LKPTQLHPEALGFFSRAIGTSTCSHFGFYNSSVLLQPKIVREHLILLKNFVDQRFQLPNFV
jgi:hypothetical protein